MDDKTYFNFFSNFVFSDKVLRKNYLINEKDFFRRKREVKIYVKKIKILNENFKNTYLLLPDRIFNFALSCGIVISKNMKLYSFKLIGDLDNLYISNEEVIKNIEDKIFLKSKKEFNPSLLKGIYFEKFNFNKTINSLVKKIKLYRKIELETFQVVEQKVFKNICPQSDFDDFNLLRNMNIEFLEVLTKNNFLENIYIYDEKKLQNIINTKFNYTTQKEVLEDSNGVEQINKVRLSYFLKFDKKKVCEKIIKCDIINFDREEIFDKIKNLNIIKISQTKENNFPLPIFISKENLKISKIENFDFFKKLSSVSYKNDFKFLKNILIKNLDGDVLKFEEFFFDEKLLGVFTQNNLDEEILDIKFRNIFELVILINYSILVKKEIRSICYIHKLDDKKILSLKKTLSKNFKFIVSKSIEENSFPKKINDFDYLNEYLKYLINSLNKSFLKYEKYPNKKNLIDKLNNIFEKINVVKKNYGIKSQNLFHLYVLNIRALEIIKIFDEEFYTKLKSFIDDYFKINVSFENDYIEDYNIFYEILKLKILSKKYKYVLVKNEMFESFVKPLNLKKINYSSGTYFIKPNTRKIKKVFKTNYIDILEKIKNSKPNTESKIKIELGKKKIFLDDTFYFKIENFLKLKLKYFSKYYNLYILENEKNE